MCSLQSPAVDSVFVAEDANIDDVFFDTPTPTSAMLTSPFAQMRLGKCSVHLNCLL